MLSEPDRSSATGVEIVPLADHPEMIQQIAGWFRLESPELSTNYDPVKRLTQFSNRGEIPLSLVALDHGEPIGTVSLLAESVRSHRHLSPWVAGLYVVPKRRHQGVATAMIAAAIREARLMRISRVYIGVSTARDFYERSGWVYEGEGFAEEDQVMIFRRDMTYE